MLCWYLKYVLHVVSSTFTLWELRARADGRLVFLCAGTAVWHPSPCVYVSVSQLHPLPPLCQHQNCAHYGLRPSTEQGSLGRGMGLFSPNCISAEQSLAGGPISYPPIQLLFQEKNPVRAPCGAQCATLSCWHKGSSRGCPGKSARQGALLGLHFAAPQPLCLENEVSFLCFSGSRSPPVSFGLWLCFMLSGLF